MFASKTTNSCSTWTRCYLATIGYVYAIDVDPTNSATVYAGGNPGIYRTTDSGINWINVSSGLTAVVVDIAIDPFTTTTLYAASRDGVFKTTNSGGGWTNTGCSEVSCLVLDPQTQGTIYCGTATGVFKSTNAGETWVSMNNGLQDTNVTCMGIDPDNYLFVGTLSNGLYRWQLNTGSTENRVRTAYPNFCTISPNPVTDNALITYQINSPGYTHITLYNASGQLLRTLLETEHQSGVHTLFFPIFDMPAGIYFVHVETCHEVFVTKFVCCK